MYTITLHHHPASLCLHFLAATDVREVAGLIRTSELGLRLKESKQKHCFSHRCCRVSVCADRAKHAAWSMRDRSDLYR